MVRGREILGGKAAAVDRGRAAILAEVARVAVSVCLIYGGHGRRTVMVHELPGVEKVARAEGRRDGKR